MLEIVKRAEGQRSQKESVRGSDVQVSLNDWGHLVVRVITEAQVPVHDPGDFDPSKDHYAELPGDILVVFDKETSSRIIRFIKDCVK